MPANNADNFTMLRRCFLFIVVLALTGCMQAKQLAHLDPLLRLQGMSVSQDEQSKFVEAQNARFDQLLEAVKADRLKEYSDKKAIIKSFGPPVFARDVREQDQLVEQWLYRYATKYFKTDKVYLYFDAAGKLARWEYVPAPSQTASATIPSP